MDDLISRQEAIENSFEVYTKEYGWCEVVGVDAINSLPSAQPEIILCNECMHNGSFDTDCPIDWTGKHYCSFAERLTDA